MEINRNYTNLKSTLNDRETAKSYLMGSENSVDSVSNVSNNGEDISGLNDFEKGIYNEIEALFENSYKNMLTASVKITEEAMNLMESDELFKDEVLAALSEQVWNNQTDGVTSYHSMFTITEDGVKVANDTVSSFESTASKEAKLSYAKSQASGSFITSGFDGSISSSSNKVNLSSFINAVNNVEDDATYAELWVQQSIISSYTNNISSSYSQALLDLNK